MTEDKFLPGLIQVSRPSHVHKHTDTPEDGGGGKGFEFQTALHPPSRFSDPVREEEGREGALNSCSGGSGRDKREKTLQKVFYFFLVVFVRRQAQYPMGRVASGEDKDMPHQPLHVRKSHSEIVKSFYGVLRILQTVLGTGLWATIAANKYEGSVHFVLFVGVLFWLLTLALFFLTLLGKQDLVPLVGGERWLTTNSVHDLVATLLYVVAIGVMVSKTKEKAFCTMKHYKHACPYWVYLTASIFCCLCGVAYLLSAVHGWCRKCRGEQTVV